MSCVSFLLQAGCYLGMVQNKVIMTVEDLKMKLIQLQLTAADDEIRHAVVNMLFAIELDNEWTDDELQEYWREIELVERELSKVHLLSSLEHQRN